MSEEPVRRKKSKKSKGKKGTSSSVAGDSVHSMDSAGPFPEDPEGGLYGNGDGNGNGAQTLEEARPKGDDVFQHQF